MYDWTVVASNGVRYVASPPDRYWKPSSSATEAVAFLFTKNELSIHRSLSLEEIRDNPLAALLSEYAFGRNHSMRSSIAYRAPHSSLGTIQIFNIIWFLHICNASNRCGLLTALCT